MDLFGNKFKIVGEILFYIEMFNSTGYITDLKTIQEYINELYSYKAVKSQIVAGQLARYANTILKDIIKRKHGDYKIIKHKKIELGQDPLLIYNNYEPEQ